MATGKAGKPAWRRGALYAAVILAPSLLVPLALPAFQRPPPCVDARSRAAYVGFERIREGMTEKEVERLLGGPRGLQDKTKPCHGHLVIGSCHQATRTRSIDDGFGGHSSYWYFPDFQITVSFGPTGVTGKDTDPPPRLSPFERAKGRLTRAGWWPRPS